MKLLKLLFAIVFAVSVNTSIANENNALCMPNNGGGTMVLTKAKAGIENTYVAISTTSRGRAIYGQWSLIGDFTIMIVWLPNGETSMFDVADFSPCRL